VNDLTIAFKNYDDNKAKQGKVMVRGKSIGGKSLKPATQYVNAILDMLHEYGSDCVRNLIEKESAGKFERIVVEWAAERSNDSTENDQCLDMPFFHRSVPSVNKKQQGQAKMSMNVTANARSGLQAPYLLVTLSYMCQH